ncbi:MAG: TAXI family TRAP transporter solute-binding subunit [Gemmatimonadales bacterium]
MPFPTQPARRRLLLGLLVALATVVVGAALWWAADQIRPLPPSRLVMTTGPEGSAYRVLGLQYQRILATHGIDLELRPSEGDVENLSRLQDSSSGVDVGFVQGGLTDGTRSPGLSSLGTVMIEPLWIFYRPDAVRPTGYLADFRTARLSVGPVGSGSRALTMMLIARAGIDTDSALLAGLPPDSAAAALLAGQIDAAAILTGWEAPAIQRLLNAPGIELLPLKRVEAFAALYPFLEMVVLPEGIGDLATDNPPTDVPMLADQASLVVRRDMHPAVQHVLLDAAEQIHARPGVFNRAGQYPAAAAVDLALSAEARHYYKSGRPFLQRHLPFWAAAVLERMLLLLLPLLGIVIPLVRLTPVAVAAVVRRRVLGLYNELRALERELRAIGAEVPPQALVERLDRLDQRAHAMWLPMSFMPMIYTLRHHIALVREQMNVR